MLVQHRLHTFMRTPVVTEDGPTLTLVASCSFTGADLSPLPACTEGQTWTDLSGSWVVLSNRATNGDDQTAITVISTPGVSDVQVSALVYEPGESIGIAFRVVDATHGMVAVFSSTGVQLIADGLDGATVTGLTVVDGDRVGVQAQGSSIKFLVNGVVVGTTTDATHLTATKHGLARCTDPAAADDFKVYSVT